MRSRFAQVLTSSIIILPIILAILSVAYTQEEEEYDCEGLFPQALWYPGPENYSIVYERFCIDCGDCECTIPDELLKYDCTPPELWYGWTSDMPDSYSCCAERKATVVITPFCRFMDCATS